MLLVIVVIGVLAASTGCQPAPLPQLKERCWLTGHELSERKEIIDELKAALAASRSGNKSEWSEQGGWIYQANIGDKIEFIRAGGDVYHDLLSVDLSNPPQKEGFTLVATYHTHPITPLEVDGIIADTYKPSEDDEKNAKRRNLPGIIQPADGRLFVYGPKRRGADPQNAGPGPVDGGFPGSSADTRDCQ